MVEVSVIKRALFPRNTCRRAMRLAEYFPSDHWTVGVFMHLVEELMQKKVFTVEPDDLVDRVFFLIHYERIRHLPVVENGRVVGIVSDRDLYKALGPRHRPRSVAQQKEGSELYVVPRKVKTIMHRGVETITADSRASKAASIMAEKRIGALPVVNEEHKLIGIITGTDILKTFSKLEKRLEKLEKRNTTAQQELKQAAS
jgi:acetoin utilization protein AcuB